ncbi:hypothetical protein Tco_1410422 [Tanacetum coccineum]
MTSPNKPKSKSSRVAKISVRPIWRKKLNTCDTSSENNVNSPTPIPKSHSTLYDSSQEINPSTQANHNSIPFSDICVTNDEDTPILPQVVNLLHSQKTNPQLPVDSNSNSRSLTEDYRLAREITRMSGEVNNVVIARAQFLDELDSLGTRHVPAKMAEFFHEIQMKDCEIVDKLQILAREMELNARKKIPLVDHWWRYQLDNLSDTQIVEDFEKLIIMGEQEKDLVSRHEIKRKKVPGVVRMFSVVGCSGRLLIHPVDNSSLSKWKENGYKKAGALFFNGRVEEAQWNKVALDVMWPGRGNFILLNGEDWIVT